MILALTIKAMMGLGMIINISKKASSGDAPPAGGDSADFSDAANSMYVPLLFGGMG
mgnify:CR=1 FL=1